MIIEVSPRHPQPRQILRIIDLLKSGGIIAYPTDTYYGVGCSIYEKKAIDKIHLIKEKDERLYSFIFHDFSTISQYAHVSNFAFKILKKHLPGAYTFILPATNLIPKIMITKRRTIGIRIPNHNICLEIAKALNAPLINTSLPMDEEHALVDPHSINNKYRHIIDLIIDSHEQLFPEPSTVVDLTTDEPTVIREGKGDVSQFIS